MKYSFKDIDKDELYERSRVICIFGKYAYFNKKVSDRVKRICQNSVTRVSINNIGLDAEFGIDESENENVSTSLDFEDFMKTVDSPSINGLWYCVTSYNVLNKTQKEQFLRYIRDPSPNGRLVIISEDWMEYRELLRNRVLTTSFASSYIELNFPDRKLLKNILMQDFADRGVELDSKAADLFLIKLSKAYDKYEETIEAVVEKFIGDRAEQSEQAGLVYMSVNDMKDCSKGIQYYVIEDFVYALLKPMSSGRTNSKKVLKIMSALVDDMGADAVLYKVKKVVNESIEFRELINKGIIPIKLKFFYKDVMKSIEDIYGEKNKYSKMSEYAFRQKAHLASETSLRDWVYMKIIIDKVLSYHNANDTDRYKAAIYELCTRSVLSESRLNNILGVENVLNKDLDDIDAYMLPR